MRAGFAFVLCALAIAAVAGESGAPVSIAIEDYVAFPITGKLDGTGQTDGMLARINSLREEPEEQPGSSSTT